MSAFAGQLRAECTLLLRDKGVLTFALFFPVLTVLFFGYLNRDGQVGDVSYASFLIAGGVGMVVSSAAFENLGVTLARQRDVEATALGAFTDSGEFLVRHGDRPVARIDMEFLHDGCPRMTIEAKWTPPRTPPPARGR